MWPASAPARVRDGNDYVLNGAKMFITNGVHGDLYFIAARTDPEAKGSRAITMFIVEKGTPGFKVGRALDKTGWRSSDTAELDLRGLPGAGRERAGRAQSRLLFHHGQLPDRAAGDRRHGHGRGARGHPAHLRACRTRAPRSAKPLWDKQAIRQRLSHRLAEVEAARQLVHHTAWLDAQGTDCVAQVSMVKALAGDLVNQVLYDCVQFHGGMGFVRETAVERMARDARVQSIGGGASEVMLEEVAKRFGAALAD